MGTGELADGGRRRRRHSEDSGTLTGLQRRDDQQEIRFSIDDRNDNDRPPGTFFIE